LGAPPRKALHPLVGLALEEDGLHPDLKVRMHQGLQSGAATADLVVDAPHRLQRRSRIGLLHRSVELPFESLDVVLVVHLMARSISPTSADDEAPSLGEAIGAIAEASSSVVGERAPGRPGDIGELEVRSRLASVKVGVWLSVIVCIGSAAYSL